MGFAHPVLNASLLLCLVIGIADGDTLTARCGQPGSYEQIKVRLGAIDAPERQQPFSQQSRQKLSSLVFGKQVGLDCPKKDRYGQHVCTVMVPAGGSSDGKPTVDAGLIMVRSGMAWWYRGYAREQTPEARERYAAAEREAQTRRLGLWADPDPTPPWEWRKAIRATKTNAKNPS